MTETTGYEARTIHRMLELVPSGIPDSGSMSGNNAPSGKNGSFSSGGMHFDRNEENPIEADVIIIDETSMVDIMLMHALLRAVAPGTRLIFVGDVDQLPSVGPGNVLKDMIRSERLKVVRLEHIFRQAQESAIIMNAHRINRGDDPVLNENGTDFFFVKRAFGEDVVRTIRDLVLTRLPKFTGCDGLRDMQVLTPMRKGVLGVQNLNTVLQAALNPPSEERAEKNFVRLCSEKGTRSCRSEIIIRWNGKSGDDMGCH